MSVTKDEAKEYYERMKGGLGKNGKFSDEDWAGMSSEEKQKFIKGKRASKPKKPKSSYEEIGETCVQLFEMVQSAANHGGANGSLKSAIRAKQAAKRAKQAALNEIRQKEYFPAETALMELCVPKPSPERASVDASSSVNADIFTAWDTLKEAYKKLRLKRDPHEEEDDHIDQRMKLMTKAMSTVGSYMPEMLTESVDFQKFFELAFTKSFYNLFECYEKKGTKDDHRTVIREQDLTIYDQILTKIKNLKKSKDPADVKFKDMFQWINDRHITDNMNYMLLRGKEPKKNDDKDNSDVDELLTDVFDTDENNLEAFHNAMCKSRAPFASKQSSKKADEVTSLIDQIRAELGGGGAKK